MLKVKKNFKKEYDDAIDKLSDDNLKNIDVNDIKLSDFLPDEMPENKDKRKILEKEANDNLILAKRIELLDMTNYQEVENWRNSLKERKYISDINRACNNYQEGNKKIERDLKIAKENVDNAQYMSESASDALKSHGEFDYKENNNDKFSEQLKINKSTKEDISFDWPKEDLPCEEFELKSNGNERWLIISDENQLDLAYQDADRLNAIICINNPM